MKANKTLQSQDQNIEEHHADVLIIGAGLAGLITAHELLDSGKKILILDRDNKENMGGLAKQSFGGVLLIDTPHQRKMGIHDSVELALADWYRYAEFGKEDALPKQWAELYCKRANDLIYEYLERVGVQFLPVVNWPERGMHRVGNSVPRWHITWGTGYSVVEQVSKHLFAHKNIENLTMLFNRKVTRFFKKQNVVTGCAGVGEQDGKEFQAFAKEVVLASGGICGGDLSTLREYWSKKFPFPQRLVNGAHIFGDGLLHKAAKKIGAQLTHLDKQWHYAAGIYHPQPKLSHQGLSLVPVRSALWLNAVGERIGEKQGQPLVGYTDTLFLVEQILQQPGQFSWQIMNFKIAAKELAVSGSDYMDAFRYKKKIRLITDLLFGNKNLLKRLEQESKDVIFAYSIEELAEKMNLLEARESKLEMNQEVLEQAILRYDQEVERGKKFITDEQIRRNLASRKYRGDRIRMCNLQKIMDKKAMPLIAIRQFILSRKSLGGVQTNLDSQVLDAKGNAINGLYAVGEAAGFGGGGIHGLRSLEGTFLGGCVLTARIAAQSIHR